MTIWPAAQIVALQTAIGQGATSVEYDGKKVTYASVAVMLALLDRMQRDNARATTASRPPLCRASVFRRP
ncbi:MAG TPA: hypothetical protein DEQ40_14395 [Oxalobacteraceae bacterium]|jgi:hypothetical protein|nr:hypothetical protein [Oxalobacteraceae bacterium]